MIEIIYKKQRVYLEYTEENRNKSILELITENFECSYSSCPGAGEHHGKCGKCKVLITGEDGVTCEKRACATWPFDNISVVCQFVEEDNACGSSVLAIEGCDHEINSYDIAIDLGTTTIAMKRGEQVFTCANPQRIYGSDVMSRISESVNGRSLRLMNTVRDSIIKGLRELAGENKDVNVLLSANTAMVHMLMGWSCEGLGKYPFTPISLEAVELMLDGWRVKTIPGISSFVGGDILSGIYSVEYLREFQQDDKCWILIDLGTNGEMVLKKGGNYLCTSAAAGSAFEGDLTANVPGTDLLAILASMYRKGIIDSTGLLSDEYFEEGYCVDDKICIVQKHIRDFQMAKAAIYSGIQILLKKAGIRADEIEQVYISGGFGYYMNPEDAFTVGMVDECFHGKIKSIGNSSLTGARLLLERPEDFKRLDSIRSLCESYSLALDEDFKDIYMGAIDFPVEYGRND